MIMTSSEEDPSTNGGFYSITILCSREPLRRERIWWVHGVDDEDGHMTLPVKCQERHGYVMVDLQHIVSGFHLVHTSANEC